MAGEADPVPYSAQRFPLSDGQAEKWLGSHYSEDAVLAFGEGVELAFEGSLDVDALAKAVHAVAERHEVFSMRFDEDGAGQAFQPPSGIALQHRDFRESSDPLAAYADFSRQCAGLRFDPARPPLLKAWLCRLAAARWRLLIRTHHLVSDGWSLRITLQDLVAHYNREVTGQGRLPPADSWTDYVLAERAIRDGEPGRRSLAYWLGLYRDRPEPSRLPTDFPRRARLGFAARTMEREVPAELWGRLRETARRLGASRFALLLAGQALLMHRLSGQADIVCGVPFAGAATGRARRVVGDTGSTLPLRIQVRPDEPLPDFVRRVNASLRTAALHQDVSLGRIVDALSLAREPGRMLLVESILSLNPAIERLDFHGVACRLQLLPHAASAWELAWQWRPLPGGRVVLEVQYQTALYRESTMRAWSGAFIDLLAEIVAMSAGHDAAQVPVSMLGSRRPSTEFVLTDTQPRPWRHDLSLPDLLAPGFSSFAGRAAVRCGDECVTYAELERASRAAARGLAVRGMGQGALVGICMRRSPDMLAATLAVLRCGAAYVPLDPAFPPQRLAWMAGHAGLAAIVADDLRALPETLAGSACEALEFSSLAAAGEGVAHPLPKVTGHDLAYVLYTSGSTGTPKGVRVLHRNLANFLLAMRDAPGFGPDDSICAATTLSFDIAALELYLPLLCGGCVVIAGDDEHRDPQALVRLIERTGCTVLQTTPTLLSLLLQVGSGEVLRPLKLLVGGEALPAGLASALLPRCRELWNLYGPTETTVWSCAARLEAPLDEVPLGTPVANTRIYLLDGARRPTLPGAIGEIWIGGAGVAGGYLHAPELSAERFVEDPFAGDGSRMYRTGDLGRIRDGSLYFHGRVDEQIKLRGFRIEPGEIEAVVAEEAGVAECVALVRDVPGGDPILVLYAGSRSDPGALRRRIQARLEEHLPPYMRPHRIEVLPALPQTPNGKIDRRALPAPGPAPAAGAVNRGEPPRDAIESALCAQWERLLGQEAVRVDDNFFELGGDSMLAVRMFAELRDRQGVDLPLATLIERPTVARLADALRTSAPKSMQAGAPAMPEASVRASARSGPLVELRPGASGTPVFLVHAVGGHVLNYVAMAQAMPPGRPVYGLQSPGLMEGAEPLDSIEAMAALYAQEVRRAHPQGPYVLAGGSMGGVVALEVARRLAAAGGEIALLGLFDTYGPGMPRDPAESPWRVRGAWGRYRALEPERRRWLWRRIGFRLGKLPALWLARLLGRRRTREFDIHAVEQANQRALLKYQPRHYPGEVVLFRARGNDDSGDPTLGWRDHVDGVDVIHIDARHDNIIEHAELEERFAERVAAC